MFSFQVYFSYSIRVTCFLVIFFLMVAVLIVFYAVFPWLWFLGWGLALVHAVHTWRLNSKITALGIDPNGHARMYWNNRFSSEVSLREGSFVSSYVLVLRWQLDKRKIIQVVTPDMTDKTSYRRLLVWARWNRHDADSSSFR